MLTKPCCLFLLGTQLNYISEPSLQLYGSCNWVLVNGTWEVECVTCKPSPAPKTSCISPMLSLPSSLDKMQKIQWRTPLGATRWKKPESLKDHMEGCPRNSDWTRTVEFCVSAGSLLWLKQQVRVTALNSEHGPQPRKPSAMSCLQDRTNLNITILALSKSKFVLQFWTFMSYWQLLVWSILLKKIPMVS